jgi:putative nucleotidyltransferase with HDIG domain
MLRLTIFGTPILAAAVSVRLTMGLLPAGALRIAGSLLMALLAGLLTERVVRLLAPLESLLRMTMLFPGRAPSRVRVLRTASGARQLEEHLAAAEGPDASAELMLALITALGAHDKRTRGHSERVRMFTELLADELHLPDPDKDRLRWAALLHDVGKLEIATRMLNTPGQLDESEWHRMRRHPELGAQLAAPLMGWLGQWGSAIPEHHERWDGTGYPRGLVGRSISPAGRIVAVVDAFETMTSARPYKRAMSTRAALAELTRCAGSHFDPAVVRAFLSISLPRLLWATGPLGLLVQLPAFGKTQLITANLMSGVTSTAASAGAATVVGAGVVLASPVPAAPVQPAAATAVVDAGDVTDASDSARATDAALPPTGDHALPPTSESTDAPGQEQEGAGGSEDVAPAPAQKDVKEGRPAHANETGRPAHAGQTGPPAHAAKPTAKPSKDGKKNDKAADKSVKDAEKTADKAAKDAEKAAKDDAKAREEARKAAEKAEREATKAADEKRKAAEKAVEEQRKAAEKAAKDAEKTQPTKPPQGQSPGGGKESSGKGKKKDD